MDFADYSWSTVNERKQHLYNSRSKLLFFVSLPRKHRQPISLSIIFKGKEKLFLAIDVIVRVSSTSKMFPLSRHTITGEHDQLIWSSFDYGIRGSLLTFEMFVLDASVKGK